MAFGNNQVTVLLKRKVYDVNHRLLLLFAPPSYVLQYHIIIRLSLYIRVLVYVTLLLVSYFKYRYTTVPEQCKAFLILRATQAPSNIKPLTSLYVNHVQVHKCTSLTLMNSIKLSY